MLALCEVVTSNVRIMSPCGVGHDLPIDGVFKEVEYVVTVVLHVYAIVLPWWSADWHVGEPRAVSSVGELAFVRASDVSDDSFSETEDLVWRVGKHEWGTADSAEVTASVLYTG